MTQNTIPCSWFLLFNVTGDEIILKRIRSTNDLGGP